MPPTLRLLARTSRPRFWIYLVGPWILGAFAGAPDATFFLGPVFWLGLAYFVVPANLLVYGVNDWFDWETDRLNAKKAGDEAGYEALLDPSGRRLVALAILATHLPFAVLAVVAARSGSLAVAVLLAWGSFLFTSIGYSAPPIRAKARPVVDSLFNVLYACPGFAAFLAAAPVGSSLPIGVVVGAWAWCMAMHAFSAVPDIEADREAGVATVATWLGARGTVWACAALYALATFLAWNASPWPLVRVVLPILGLGYCAFMAMALRALPGTGVFAIYKRFPLWNAFVGFAITMAVLWSRWQALRPG